MSRQEPRETSASRRARSPGRDPRDIVTEYAFHVDPDLMGVPLAGAFRRLLSMLADLGLLALIFPFKAILDSLVGGVTDVLVAGLAAWVLWRLGEERKEPSLASRVITWGGRAVAGFIALVAGLSFVLGLFQDSPADRARQWGERARQVAAAVQADSAPGADGGQEGGEVRDSLESLLEGEMEDVAEGDSADAFLSSGLQALGTTGRGGGGDGGDVELGDILSGAVGVGQVVALGRDVQRLTEASSAGEAQPVADRLALRLQRMGIDPGRVEEALQEEIESSADTLRPWMSEVLERAAGRVDSLASARRAEGDSLLALWIRAREAGDTARAEALRPELVSLVAADSLEELREAREENEELEQRVDELTTAEGYLQRLLDRILDDLGVGFGSAALFFTVAIRLFGGRTPGKKLLGTRVVRLNGEPLSWWDSFSRFGGYLIGPVTGFLGWLQVFWDPNRQAVHDKIAGTAVIRTRGPGKRFRPGEE
jgi:hypothetical protein